MSVNDLIFFTIIFIAVIFLAVKAVRDYGVLTSENSEKIFINPKNFIWKAGVFLFVAVAIIPFSTKKNISTYLLFSCLLGIGFWNMYFAVKYRNFKKKN